MGLLRILLAICLLFQHCGPLGSIHWVSGTAAVEMFFVISGFYMQMVLRGRYTESRLGRGYVVKFYLARYTRLYPAYFLCLLLTILAALAYNVVKGTPAPLLDSWAAMRKLPFSFSNLALWIWMAVCNALIAFQDFALLLAVKGSQAQFSLDRLSSDIYVGSSLAIPQAWSLGVELAFYAVSPFLLRLRTSVLVPIFLLALLTKCFAVFGTHLGDLPYRLLPFVIVDFLAGALAYRWQARLTSQKLLASGLGRWAAYALVAVLVIAFPVTVGPVSLLLVALTALFIPTVFAATKGSSLDTAIGELSYPFYIFHLLVSEAVGAVLKLRPMYAGNPQLLIWAALLGTLGVSWLVMRAELKWIEPWRRRFGRSPSAQNRDSAGSFSAARDLGHA